MSPNKEDYLKAIVELGGDVGLVNNKQLVQSLSVSAASVTEMTAKLLKEGHITHVPYQGVQVTEEGLRIANKLIRKHRLWEVFLFEKLRYDWDQVHEEAELLEHVSSDFLADRLSQFLGHPKVDPHGGVIPDQDGTSETTDFPPLIELNIGSPFIVRQVEDNPEFLQYLQKKNIKLGEQYTVHEIEEYEGPISLLHSSQETVIVSYKSAYKIFVEPLDN